MNGLMHGRRGLVMGVANDHSIAWGIAQVLSRHGAELAFTYQGEALGKRVAPLARSLGSDLVMPCDVEDLASLDAAFAALDRRWDGLDFVVHAIGFSDKAQLKGRYVDVTTRENFSRTMVISCFSFTEVAQRAATRMRAGGSLLTLTYGGSQRVMPNYNVMGVAKAALEASVRYIAPISGRRTSAATPSRPARCGPSRGPASPMRATCSPTRRPTRPCAARSRSRRSAARPSTSCPTSRAA